MGSTTMKDEYAKLMARHGEGQYLYTPVAATALHPGSVGYFNRDGAWIPITDLCDPTRLAQDGYTPCPAPLQRAPPTSSVRSVRTSESENSRSFGLEAEASGILAAAPVDVGAHAKNVASATGQAAIATEFPVTFESFAGAYMPIIKQWVKANRKAFLKTIHAEDVKRAGVMAITRMWTTPECAIVMGSSRSRETSGGVKVGASAVGKLGADASVASKLQALGWTAYKGTEADPNLVISFGALNYTYRRFLPARGDVTEVVIKLGNKFGPKPKVIYNEAGEPIGMKYHWPVVGEDGRLSLTWVERLDENRVEDKTTSTETKEGHDDGVVAKNAAVEDDDDELDFDDNEAGIGITEAEIEENEQLARLELAKRKLEHATLVSDFVVKITTIDADEVLDTASKKRKLQELLDENEHVKGAWDALALDLRKRQSE